MSRRNSRWRIGVLLILLVIGLAHESTTAAQQPPPRAAQDEFTPIDQLPPDEKLPAARLLIAAYAVAWVLVALYLWSIWKRLGQVERELADVSRRLEQGSRKPPGAGSGRR
jgi:CcmD family protein